MAPAWSATITSKLAVSVLVPSCLKSTRPPCRSAWVNLATGLVGPFARVMNPLVALEMLKTSSLASSSGSMALRASDDGQIEVAGDGGRHVADLGAEVGADLHGELAILNVAGDGP